jgi:hypothetical protein
MADSRERERSKIKLEIRLLRYAAGAITALAFIGGAGWLLHERAKRRKASAPADAEND